MQTVSAESHFSWTVVSAGSRRLHTVSAEAKIGRLLYTCGNSFASYENTVNPLYNDIHFNSRIHYNVNLINTKISGSFLILFIFPCYSSRKHTFCVVVIIALVRRF